MEWKTAKIQLKLTVSVLFIRRYESLSINWENPNHNADIWIHNQTPIINLFNFFSLLLIENFIQSSLSIDEDFGGRKLKKKQKKKKKNQHTWFVEIKLSLFWVFFHLNCQYTCLFVVVVVVANRWIFMVFFSSLFSMLSVDFFLSIVFSLVDDVNVEICCCCSSSCCCWWWRWNEH